VERKKEEEESKNTKKQCAKQPPPVLRIKEPKLFQLLWPAATSQNETPD